MNKQEFVETIKIVVERDSINSVTSNLLKPPGRSPDQTLVLMSEWYNNLDEQNKEMVLKVIKETVNTTVFGFLCVLDGVRAIENGEDKGHLSLYYQKNGEQTLLNDPDDEYLHDVFSE